MANKRKAPEIEFFSYNLTVLPAPADTKEYYSKLIKKFFKKDLRIRIGNDFYFAMTRLDSFENDDIFYGVISKFYQLDGIDWIKTQDGMVSEFELPEGLEGRKSNYEVVFSPSNHKIAFIKKGKINTELKKHGAPLKALAQVLKIGFEQVLEGNKEVFVDIIQSDQIFDKIFSSEVLRLEMTVHYTNPNLNNDHEEFMDDLLKKSRIGKARIALTPDKSGSIDTSEKFVNGTLGIAQENGSVKASIKTAEGVETINTISHPKVTPVVGESGENRYISLIKSVFDRLKGNREDE